MFPADNVRTDSMDMSTPSDEFKMMPLNKFCVKRFFEIGFINAANIEDETFIDSLVALNKTKQDITHVTFIDEKDVRNFLVSVANEEENLEFPPFLMEELKQFVEYASTMELNDPETTMEYQAYKIKFKLIQTMYEQYANVVLEMRRRDRLNRDLDTLAERKSTARGKKSTTDVKSGSSRSGKRQEKAEREDYTEVDLMDSDLVIDDAAKNQVYFYILRGFNSIDVVKYLLKISVKLSFIVRLSEYEVDEKKHINHFWREYTFVRNCPCDYLQNIAVFKYQAPPHQDVNAILETSLADLTEIVKKLIDYKRLHFHYIKNLKIVNTKFTETFRSFPIYENIMNSYPLETVTIPLVLNSMLQEVQMKLDKKLKTNSFHKPLPKTTKHKTRCPFDIRSMLETKKREKKTENRKQSFRIYEKDYVNLTFRSYDNVGVQYVRDNLDILNLQMPIMLARECQSEDTIDDFQVHTHDVVIPSEEEPCFTDEQTTHLINLLYLKNRYFHDYEDQQVVGNEYTKNVVIFDKNHHLRNMLPHCLTDEVWKIDEPFIDHFPQSNQYEFLRPMALHWAEMLKPEVLCQHLLESELKFLCCDYIHCKLTNSLIVRYHNNVNSFGLHTKVWREYLRTPVGLGDFCRFTLVDDYDWLKENGIYPQVTYVEVAKMMEEHTAMYQYGDPANRDYRSLLVPQIQYSVSDIRQSTKCPCIEENVCEILESCNGETISGYLDMSANLESILKDLEEYNNVVDFSEHCKGKSDQDYSFAAYNFGVTKFSIVGHTTDFISLDHVRVTVDTSRFCHEQFKMVVKITTDYNMFVIHVPQNRFGCHVFLSDGTIVVFSKPVVPKVNEEKSVVQEEESKLTFLDLDEAIGGPQRKDTIESDLSEYLLHGPPGDTETTLTAIDFEHYRSQELFPAVGNIVRISPKEMFKTNIKKDIDLLKRLQQNTKCLKVSCRSSEKIDLNLRSKIPERQVALSSVVKRILDKHADMENREAPKRKCVIKNAEGLFKTNPIYDCTVTVPNGLCISVLPSEIHDNTSVIKQSYELQPGPEAVSDESYRMFTHDGTLIVGKLDGSIHLLMSSGREIRFSKPTNLKDEAFCRVKTQITEDLIRKAFTRMMSDRQDPAASEYYISRRGHIKSKYAIIEGCDSFNEISKLPFSSVCMINFEGEKITIKNKKIYKYQYSRHTTEINFQTEERYYRREDGFSSKIDRDGTQYVKFPDETGIKTVVSVSDEPIRFSKKDKMGWILITSTFLYEHPYYKPVFFDNINFYIEIQMNVHDTLHLNSQGGFLSMRNSTYIDLKTDFVTFTKDCHRCGSQYKCRLFVEPLYQNRNLKEEKDFFVDVEDSYRKTFKADFQGNCKIDPNYIHTAMNERKCQHSIQTDHQKIYLIKNNLEGMVLWNDKAASAAMRDSEDANIHHFNDERNTLIFLTITRNVFTSFNERFFGTALRDVEIPLTKSDITNNLVYQTTRNLYSMFELDQVNGLMNCLKKFFQEEVMRELALSLSALKFHLSSSKFSIHSLSQSYPEEYEMPSKPVITLHEKLKEINRKIAGSRKIMKMKLPNYFHSKFSTFVDTERSSLLRIQSRTSSPDTELVN
ncbi:uncharacterized protein LOC123314296 [Coccinella septempunctata]|uniref:uncharacterized protein LOC123314296 n=1 Tax=Coccinella septempunctata TaxID=41139 RepID=UPI001D061F56|nr:uncharacterized protein LOC123314296 [Coccinella septempunctata]